MEEKLWKRNMSFKFLITKKWTWSTHTHTVVKRARQRLFSLRRLKRLCMGPRILKKFYSCNIKSSLTGCITTWYAPPSTTKRYRGWCGQPSTSLGPSSLPFRTSISDGVRGRPEKLPKTSATIQQTNIRKHTHTFILIIDWCYSVLYLLLLLLTILMPNQVTLSLCTIHQNINATCKVLAPCFMSWNRRSQKCYIHTKSWYISNVGHKFVYIPVSDLSFDKIIHPPDRCGLSWSWLNSMIIRQVRLVLGTVKGYSKMCPTVAVGLWYGQA